MTLDPLEALIEIAEARVAAKKKATPSFRSEEVIFDFLPHRLIALFHRTTCSRCGATEDAFEGLFEERRHYRRNSEKHLVRLPFVPPAGSPLPRARSILNTSVPYCVHCVDVDTYSEVSE